MAEQFRFQKRLHDGGAVHGNKRFVRRGVVVNHFGDQFLAGAAFSMNQHRRSALGYGADRFENFPHLVAGADDVSHPETARRLHQQPVNFFLHLQGLQGFLDRQIQLIHVDRLVNVVKGAALHGVDGRFHVVESGDHDHFDVFIFFLEIFQNGKPVHIRQTDVQDDHVRRLLHVFIQTVGTGQRRPNAVSLFG
ncbi:MAG: hypothetical protein BWX45_01253 [Deltaproteobacteria bacterium ADurb.Bin002]|nr:MAG: hypothetical protein BWX45_01253 [Deltaproteobacteria bacterium ADurb.Bin002]